MQLLTFVAAVLFDMFSVQIVWDERLLADAFQSAGFRDGKIQAVSHVNRGASAEEFIRAREGAAAGPLGEALGRLSEAERMKVKQEIVQALRKYEGENGFEAPSESLLVVGSK